jgi:hypothetical protein
LNSTDFHSHPWDCAGHAGSENGFAVSLAESLRLSVSHLLLLRGYASTIALIVLVGMLSACGQSNTNRPAGDSATAQPSTSSVPLSGFERDLQFIRNGQFTHVWVFSRKDGQPLDKDDAAFLRTNAPQVVDWVTTDDKKRVIAGTNFDLELGNMPQLRQRFVTEDYTGK